MHRNQATTSTHKESNYETIIPFPILCGALLAASLCSALSADEPSAAASARHGPQGGGAGDDHRLGRSHQSAETREVTLKGPLGNTVTFTVDQRVKRLNEVKVGDFVRADYYISIAAELRKPTPEEEKNPIVVAGRRRQGASRHLARRGRLAPVQGRDDHRGPGPPDRNHHRQRSARQLPDRPVADPSRLTQMRIGENIVVTYTEALADFAREGREEKRGLSRGRVPAHAGTAKPL